MFVIHRIACSLIDVCWRHDGRSQVEVTNGAVQWQSIPPTWFDGVGDIMQERPLKGNRSPPCCGQHGVGYCRSVIAPLPCPFPQAVGPPR